MKTSKNVIEKPKKETENNIHQGDCVYLKNQDELFQVLGIDNAYEKCWVRNGHLILMDPLSSRYQLNKYLQINKYFSQVEVIIKSHTKC